MKGKKGNKGKPASPKKGISFGKKIGGGASEAVKKKRAAQKKALREY